MRFTVRDTTSGRYQSITVHAPVKNATMLYKCYEVIDEVSFRPPLQRSCCCCDILFFSCIANIVIGSGYVLLLYSRIRTVPTCVQHTVLPNSVLLQVVTDDFVRSVVTGYRYRKMFRKKQKLGARRHRGRASSRFCRHCPCFGCCFSIWGKLRSSPSCVFRQGISVTYLFVRRS